MTQVERCRHVEVLYIISTTAPWKTCYDQLIATYRAQFNSAIHEEEFFFPWYRWFILSLENLLRQINCTITVPYWDWSASHRPGRTRWFGPLSAGSGETEGAFAESCVHIVPSMMQCTLLWRLLYTRPCQVENSDTPNAWGTWDGPQPRLRPQPPARLRPRVRPAPVTPLLHQHLLHAPLPSRDELLRILPE